MKIFEIWKQSHCFREVESVFHSLDGNHSFGNGKASEASNAVNVELAHDAFAMGFDGANTEVELDGDFFVAEAFGDENEHFAFATPSSASCFSRASFPVSASDPSTGFSTLKRSTPIQLSIIP